MEIITVSGEDVLGAPGLTHLAISHSSPHLGELMTTISHFNLYKCLSLP